MKKIINALMATVFVASTILSQKTSVLADGTYKQVIDFKYDYVSEFSEGLALASEGTTLGYIDTKGNFKIKLDCQDGGQFSEGFAAVSNDGKIGFINTSGDLVVDYLYDSVEPFKGGLALVVENDLYGYIDTTGNIVVPIKYNYATSFDEENQALVQEDNLYHLIDTKGNVLKTYEYGTVYAFSEGLAGYLGEFGYGFINKDGEEVIIGTNDSVREFNESVVAVYNEPLWSYLDKQGVTIAKDFDTVEDFSDGLAMVSKLSKKSFINIDGTTAFEFDYEEVEPFSEGLAAVNNNGTGGFINKTGEVAIPFDFVTVRSFSEGLAPVYDGEYWGFISSEHTDTAVGESQNPNVVKSDDSNGLLIVLMVIVPLVMAFIASIIAKRNNDKLSKK